MVLDRQTDRDLLEESIGLRNSMLEALVDVKRVQQVSKKFLLALKARMIQCRVHEVLGDRAEGFFVKIWNDRTRDSDISWFIDNGDSVSVNQLDFLGMCQTSELEKYKTYSDNFSFDESDMVTLNAIKLHEIDRKVLEVLEKYEVKSLGDLLSDDIHISTQDFQKIMFRLESGEFFRKRKISELVGYRYAHNLSLEKKPQDFILEIHDLICEGGNYREGVVTIGRHINTLYPQLLKDFMDILDLKISLESTNMNREEAEKKAMKYFVLFQIIHPFVDGNGRVGRALFIFLVRKFTKDNPQRSIIFPHIPIEYQRDDDFSGDGTSFRNVNGSIATDINMALVKVVQDEKILSLLEVENQAIYMKAEQSPEILFEKIWSLIDTEYDEEIDLMLHLRQEIAEKDTLDNKDFADIKVALKEAIKQRFLK